MESKAIATIKLVPLTEEFHTQIITILCHQIFQIEYQKNSDKCGIVHPIHVI